MEDDSWMISLSTTEAADAGGLAAQVTLTIFCLSADAMALVLGCPGAGLFQTGATDVFCVSHKEKKLVSSVSVVIDCESSFFFSLIGML